MKQLLFALAFSILLPICLFGQSCQNFNLPAPLADSCHQAPLLCGNYLEGFCSTTAGLTPDQPVSAGDTIPVFENNGWLRITPCEDSIAIEFQVFDCQTGNELGFFLLSGDCDTMTLLSFISAQDGNVAQLTAGGLTPGDVYYLVVDGFYNAECKFQAHVVHGIGTASPGEPTCDCTPSYVNGPDDLCPADIVQYTLMPGYCDVTPGQPIGGNGIYCPPPPEVCPAGQDSAVLHWVIPPFMNFLSDSVNVTTITVQVDSSLLGVDTVLTGIVTVYWEIIDLTPTDSSFYCDCTPGCIPGFLPKDVTVHHDVETIHCVLTCDQPCCFYNSQSYCTPGTYIVEQTNCLTKKLIITANLNFPIANAGPDRYICVGQSTTIGAPPAGLYAYLWNNNVFVSQQSVSPPVTTTYALYVTDVSNGCTSVDFVTVTVGPPVDSFFNAGVLNCWQPSILVFGNYYSQAGQYTVPKPNGCGNYKFTIFEDFTPPTVTIAPVPKVCFGDNVTLVATANPPFSQYFWNNNAVTPQITVVPPATTTYTVTVTNLFNGCTKTASTTVQVIPLLQTNLPPATICEGDCVNVAGDVLCPTGSGNFVVVAESYQGCDSTIFLSIIVKPYVVTNHGTVGTLTCAVTSISFMGNTYDQPGNYTLPDAGGCGEHTFTIVSDNDSPFVDVGQSQQICLGETAVLTASSNSPLVIFHWSGAAAGAQITVAPTATTTYTVVATNTANGCTSVDNVTVTVNPPVDTDLGVVGILSCGQLEINFLGNTYTQPGQYSVLKPGGCGNNNFVIMGDFTPPWCPVISVPPICAGESVTLQTAPPVPSDLQYLWSTGDTTQEITVTPLVTTTYLVTATNLANGCSSIVATTVEVNQPQLVQLGLVGTLTCLQPCFTFNGQTYCQPGTYSFTENCEIKEFQIAQDLTLPTVQLGLVGTLTCAQPCLTFNGTEYCQPGTYSFTENCEIKEFQIGQDLTLPTVQLGLVGTLTCSQPCFTFNGTEYCQPGTYSLTENCEIKEFEIGDLPPVWLELGEDQTITSGESAELQAQTNAQPAVISWHNSTGAMSETHLDITVQPVENTLYSLEIQDVNGCLLQGFVWILVKKADGGWFAPNVIKPGAGGLNEWFTLFAGNDFVSEIQLLEIYDRWGNLAFARENFPPNAPELGWNGTFKGKMLDPGVFVWHAVLLLNDRSTEKVKGDVTVVR